MTRGGWQRVSRDCPCPVCDKPDWCVIAGDGSAVICARIESTRLVKRPGKDAAGWLHRLQDPLPRRTVRRRPEPAGPNQDFATLADRYEASVCSSALREFAYRLRVSVDSLRRLGVGWDGEAWTFPMRDTAGTVIGIRRRLPSGRKLSVRGGHEGIFVPTGMKVDSPLLIAEGPTDTAALLTVGFDAVGRPNCRGGTQYLRALCDQRWVAIVTDADEAGLAGAHALAAELARVCIEVRIAVPPAGVKDARDWIGQGATRADVQAVLDDGQVTRPRVTFTPLTRRHRWFAPKRRMA